LKDAPFIADETVEEFARDGHALVRGLADPDEVARSGKAIRSAAERFSCETRSLEERDTYGRAFLQVTNLWRRDERVREFVFNKRFAAVAARLLGVGRVRLYHDQALFKEPLGGHTPWHQDQFYWPLDTDRTITMWMPLVDIDSKTGMLAFASGSHADGAVGSLKISDESDQALERHIADRGYPVFRADTMRAGDATFHLGWTMHSAGPNNSRDRMREVMTVIYFADGTRVAEPVNAYQAADLEAWLGGRRPGEPADSEMNPLL
jgi:ectoine hydroxylase-related dioxygenase (phytanoyl-CoA dioxygenase family)